MSMTTIIDAMLGRFHRCRAGRPYLDLAREMGIGVHTLTTFARGEDITLAKLRAIEAWCDAEEQKERLV